MLIRFKYPRGMSNLEVAQAFTSYLLGQQMFKNEVDKTGQRVLGPFQIRKESGRVGAWQLDRSNDFSLFFGYDGEGTARLSSRYEPDEMVAKAMIALFTLRYPDKER